MRPKAMKALVVEDAPMARLVLQGMLEDLDFNVVAVSDGHEAIKRFDPSFDIIFMDHGLPQVNGDKATQVIRQKLKPQKDLYIVGLTASNSAEIHQACIQAGMNKVMEKPINIKSLEKVLEDFGLKN